VPLYLIEKLFGRKPSPTPRPSSRRLRLEALEDRWCPAGSTLTVGSGHTYATINAALSAAKAGDTIDVYPGTYTEQLTISTGNLTLAGITVNGAIPKIQSPASLSSFTVSVGGFNIGAALIDVNAAGGDTVTNFKIDGSTNTDGNLFSGVRVRGGGSATISNNTITGLTTSSSTLFGIGIQVGTNRGGGSGATATVTGNTITSYAGAGILVDGSHASATIKTNTITGRGSGNNGEAEYGVQVSRGAFGDVETNTISGNSNGTNSGGIYFFSDGGVNSLAKKNTVESNDVGIWLDSSSATTNGKIQIVQNTVTDNSGFAGILDQSSNGVVIQTNTVNNNNTDNGIALANASNVQVTGNTVDNNASDGIYDFQGNGNTISGNTTDGNSGNGIFLDHTTSDTVSGNTSDNNNLAGLRMSSCTKITTSNNTFANNTGGDVVTN
jgi:parallel beta-helix repeat protein